MNKEIFIKELKKGLKRLPREEKRKQLSYYSELIDDMIEDGMSEAEAVARLGDVKDICDNILKEYSIQSSSDKTNKPSTGWKVVTIILLVLGSPVWISILIAIFAVVFAIYVCFWAVVITLFAVAFALAVSSLAMIVFLIFKLIASNVATAVLALAAAFLLAGLALLIGLAAYWTARGAVLTAAAMVKAVKAIFKRKES